MTLWNEIDTYAKEWIKEAGRHIKASFSTALLIQEKSNRNDLVTNMDKETEIFLKKKINLQFPDHNIFAEEGSGHDLNSLKGIVWIVDPIDGTLNFIHQQRNFAISIGVYEDGIGKIGIIYDVVNDEMYHAIAGEGAYLNEQKLPLLESVRLDESMVALNASWLIPNERVPNDQAVVLVNSVRGTRSFGSAAIEIASVAAGRMDAYLSMRLSPWDYAGGAVILNEVGGVVTDLKGNPIDLHKGNSLLVAKPGLHAKILKIFNPSEKP